MRMRVWIHTRSVSEERNRCTFIFSLFQIRPTRIQTVEVLQRNRGFQGQQEMGLF